MRRRTFIWGGVGAGALAAIAGWRLAANSQQDVVISVLRRRLGYLRLDEAGMRRFAADLVATGKISGSRLRALGAFSPLYSSIALITHDRWMHGIKHGEERITTLYLMSSDFFVNGANESLPVRYLRLYSAQTDPVACSNPFARPVIPGGDNLPGEKTPYEPAAPAATPTAAR
jgi:hypothetical protein